MEFSMFIERLNINSQIGVIIMPNRMLARKYSDMFYHTTDKCCGHGGLYDIIMFTIILTINEDIYGY